MYSPCGYDTQKCETHVCVFCFVMNRGSNGFSSYLSPGPVFGSGSTLHDCFYLKMTHPHECSVTQSYVMYFLFFFNPQVTKRFRVTVMITILTLPVLADCRWAPPHQHCLCSDKE